MCANVVNWVFLGDSLTEGVGSSRISYVTELVKMLRVEANERGRSLAVNEVRLRKVDPDSFNPFIQVNLAGQLNTDERESERALWLWNLACEGKTIDTDLEWLPLLASLKPELVIIFRGSLEGIIRPAVLQQGAWPWWLPSSWKGYAAMDPRCYFSTTWWRNIKQVATDALKQKARLRLVQAKPGKPLMKQEVLLENYSVLLARLLERGERIIMLGLLPIDGRRFPLSPESFQLINTNLSKLADSAGVEFFDWGTRLVDSQSELEDLFYRDGFHPNEAGARALASILRQHLSPLIVA
jgi:hypothetical protein